ncbi:glycosyltransferase [Pelagicoccus sp. NFK12]|uniref:Glycosyltransferase n=1 Tax=Pelagicoccus enzymogenes TaxID=2773457 RepID=A0A927F646_9BACT|nr:glycosyltransferase [Pelagicoccus enzymogenes]MBD5779094.1 glycosyltransferase [Pelagicoccus enzymogenes]MDQ8200184.1 glycosyltransferase [Pelagicoccus enzymogenes]
MKVTPESFVEKFELEKQAANADKRIAMVSTHGYVAAEPPLGMPDTGGQVVFVIELSRKLAQLGYQVDIWTRQFEGQVAEEKVDEGVRILRVPCGGDDFIAKEFLHKWIPEWSRNALAKISAEGLSYEFINSHYWDAGLAGEILSEHLACPHVHTPHSVGTWKRQKMETDFPEDKDGFDEVYNFSTRIENEQKIYDECSIVVATSPIQMDMFFEDYGLAKDRVVMIPPGYDDTRFYPVSDATRESLREKFGFEGRVITSIGRLSRNKGFDLLVDAFAVVAKRFDDVRLFMPLGSESESQAEDPMLSDIVKQIHKLGLEDRVTITQSLDDELMPDFYRASDLFCLPSRYEPFGMTAVEAMASGAPTVVTTNGGLYRTLEYGKDALYADSFDALDYGITMCKILEHPKISERLSENGSHKARSLFTWSGIAQQLIAAVEGFHGNPSSPGKLMPVA